MTALIALTTRLRLARLALVVPAELTGTEAADFAAAGADLIILSTGDRSVEEAAGEHAAARGRLFGLPALLAVDRTDVAAAAHADVVHLGRAPIRPGEARPHPYALVGGRLTGTPDLARLGGDGLDYGFVGPAIVDGAVGDEVAAAASALPPLALPAHPVWFAAGGITLDTITDVLAAGARRVTVSTAVFGAADPLAVTRSLADAVAAAWEADGGSAAYRLDAFA